MLFVHRARHAFYKRMPPKWNAFYKSFSCIYGQSSGVASGCCDIASWSASSFVFDFVAKDEHSVHSMGLFLVSFTAAVLKRPFCEALSR